MLAELLDRYEYRGGEHVFFHILFILMYIRGTGCSVYFKKGRVARYSFLQYHSILSTVGWQIRFFFLLLRNHMRYGKILFFQRNRRFRLHFLCEVDKNTFVSVLHVPAAQFFLKIGLKIVDHYQQLLEYLNKISFFNATLERKHLSLLSL